MSSNMLRPKKTHRVRNFFLIVAVLFVGIIVIANLQPAQDSTNPQTTPAPVAASPEPTPAPVNTPTDTNDKGGGIAKRVEAWAATTMLVENRLKAPRTAKFNGGAWNVVYLGNNRYRVDGSVDSQNSFGAMIRTTFQAIVRDKEDEHQTWVLEDL